MEFKRKEKAPLKINFEGRDLEIKIPSVKALLAFQDADPKQAVKKIYEFVQSMNVPADILDTMDIDDMQEFIGFVVSQKKSQGE